MNALPAVCKESFSQSTFIDIKQKHTSSCSDLQCKFETLETIFSYFAKSFAFMFFCFDVNEISRKCYDFGLILVAFKNYSSKYLNSKKTYFNLK